MQLTKTLLSVDFGLTIDLPDDRLCPAVPNRHNYILWLKGLLDSTSQGSQPRKVVGLDIGTGASCIYPLLGCAQRQEWSFIATDIDQESLEYAMRNVKLNGLGARINVLPLRRPDDSIIPYCDNTTDIDFVMTNPPFYESEADMTASAKKKSRPPNSACTGAPVEMVCQGGEVAFVKRILDASLVLREEIQWYTSMVGKLSSLETLVDMLHAEGIGNYAVTEFIQGNKTRRWAIAWSFRPMRPAQRIARGMEALAWKRIFPAPTEVVVCEAGAGKAGEVVKKVKDGMAKLELISWEWDPGQTEGKGRAWRNVWSRAWRREKKRQRKSGPDTRASSEKGYGEEVCVFGFVVSVHVGMEGAKVHCRWSEGYDEAIFQSFCGYLKTMLHQAQ